MRLSVVIASVNGFPVIGECLESLHQQAGAEGIEIVVANRCADGVATAIRETYPRVKLIEAPTETPIPQLRAMAFRACQGDVVAVLEDHCIVDRDWARRMLAAHRGEYPVIGGSVDNAACNRLVDWAAFFCEYSQAMKPLPEGKTDNIPGNNVAYKKWVLERFRPEIETGIWDSALHERIRNAGIPLYQIPSLAIHHKLSASLGWFIAQKFHFARSFSSMRLAGSAPTRRLIYGAGAVLLPLVLARRIVTRVWSSRVHRRELVLCFPILMLLLLSWGAGEAAGYLFGPGSSHAKVA
jgi:glycosyltransferase involved in cell wall biosynthesis